MKTPAAYDLTTKEGTDTMEDISKQNSIEISAEPACGLLAFETLRDRGSIYVDKTQFLSKLIKENWGVFFMARPEGFGKSLTVSTLYSILSDKIKSIPLEEQDSLSWDEKKIILLKEKKELFKGLAILENLGEERFAPRPVIHLDMSLLTTGKSKKQCYDSLKRLLVKQAAEHGLDLSSSNFSANILFGKIIEHCYHKNGIEAAILIDEYDSAVAPFLDNPAKKEDMRSYLDGFYSMLKCCGKYISFVFMTGPLIYYLESVYSGFNNYFDISAYDDLIEMMGFTHEELISNYQPQIQKAAEELNMTEDLLLEEIKKHCGEKNIFWRTFLYNPLSLLEFFRDKKFNNIEARKRLII
jgi:hypothetical protein